MSNKTEDSNIVIENVTLPSMSQFLFNNVQNNINQLLSNVFPIVKKSIQTHNGLEKDLESYRRRVRKLQRNGKDVGDKEMDKLTFKLTTTQELYIKAHTKLISEIKQLCHQKQDLLEPCYVAFTVAQSRFCKEMKETIELKATEEQFLEEKVKLSQNEFNRKLEVCIEKTKRNIEENKENDETPSKPKTALKKLKKKFTPSLSKYKSLSFRGLAKSVSITNILSETTNFENEGKEEENKEQTRYSEPKQNQSKLLRELSKHDSQDSTRHSDYAKTSRISKDYVEDDYSKRDQVREAYVEDEDDDEEEIPTIDTYKTKKNIVLDVCDDSDSDINNRTIESVDEFTDDEDIASYFTKS